MAYQSGYSSGSHDRYLAHNEQSTLHKVKETYWTTKQYVKKKLGKKEDQHLVASDMELDAKLEVFRAIQKSCLDLLRVLEQYQERVLVLSQEENAMGRFLKTQSQQDKTRAGKMMAAVGKVQSQASQQRISLRVPLVRLYQEVETFRYRAISDTLMTINRMEVARTEYRGALLWMKDASEELDPDTYKQLEKFRKVQAQVKKTKQRFDKLKLDVMQKVDLLAASRCNMFSHVLANYQSTLLTFWNKTAHTQAAVAESFKGYQYYEFNMLKELSDTTKELADQTKGSGENAEGSTKETFEYSEEDEEDDDDDDDADSPPIQQATTPQRTAAPLTLTSQHALGPLPPPSQTSSPAPEPPKLPAPPKWRPLNQTPSGNSLIDWDNSEQEEKPKSASMTNLFTDDKTSSQGSSTAPGPFLDFGEEEDEESLEEIKRRQDVELDITGGNLHTREQQQQGQKVPKDLLSEEPDISDDTDNLTLLQEILHTPAAPADNGLSDFGGIFGAAPLLAPPPADDAQQNSQQNGGQTFLPSSLLDLSQGVSSLNISNPSPAANQQQPPKQLPKTSKNQKADMSAWFNLFADLDPLANPDAVGRQTEDPNNAL